MDVEVVVCDVHEEVIDGVEDVKAWLPTARDRAAEIILEGVMVVIVSCGSCLLVSTGATCNARYVGSMSMDFCHLDYLRAFWSARPPYILLTHILLLTY